MTRPFTLRSGSSAAALLLLLLPLFWSSIRPSSAAALRCRTNVELARIIEKVQDSVKACDANCSLVSIRNTRCKCLQVSTLPRVFPDYFIHGVKSLGGARQEIVSPLVQNFEYFRGCILNERINVTKLVWTNETFISPRTFVGQMESLHQRLLSSNL